MGNLFSFLTRSKTAKEHSPWRDIRLEGKRQSRIGLLCYGGLASNGVLAQQKVAHELYRLFDCDIDIWQRNLGGHTGKYSTFRRTRMWNWLKDAQDSLRHMMLARKKDHIFLFGHSTGALVAVLLAWLYESFPGWFVRSGRCPAINGLILNAPAFSLKNRRDTKLLLMVLLLYYVVCPVAFITVAYYIRDLWDLVLLTAVLLYSLLPRIRVPTKWRLGTYDDPVKDWEARRKCRADRLRALTLVIHFGIFPLIPLFLVLWSPIEVQWVRSCLWFFIGTIVASWFYIAPGEVLETGFEPDDEESADADCYRWLPVVTAANLLPLQWSARFLLSKLKSPVLLMLAGSDRIVDNDGCIRLFRRATPRNGQLIILADVPHSDLSVEHQRLIAATMEPWMRAHIPESRCSAAAITEHR